MEDKLVSNTFNELFLMLKTEEFYVPRNYQSMGGMWTVDTWRSNNLVLKIMDEGYTKQLVFLEKEEPKWTVTNGVELGGGNKFTFNGITKEDFVRDFGPDLEVSPENKPK